MSDHAESKDDESKHESASYYEDKRSSGPSSSLEPYGAHTYPGDCPPLLLPNFTLEYDDLKASHFVCHPYTGECIYLADDYGDVTSCNRTFSHWTRPTLYFPDGGTAAECRADASHVRHAYQVRRKLLDAAPPLQIQSPDIAAVTIQAFVRSCLSRCATVLVVKQLFEKHYDEGSFLYFFVNKKTNESQWHRPVPLNQSAEHDIPEYQELLLPEYEEEYKGEHSGENKELQYNEHTPPARLSTIASYASLESSLGYSVTSRSSSKKLTYSTQKGPLKYTLGPYCKRTKGKPGRSVTKALGNRKLKEAKEVVDKNGRSGYGHPRDIDLGAELYGEKVPSLDGLIIRDIEVEPYMLLRGASEHGPMAVIDLMEKYSKNRHVVLFGFLSLAKMDIVETADGVAGEECVRATKYSLKMMDEWTENAAILAAALSCMASLSDNYANRIVINEEKWMQRVVKLMKNMESETQELYIRFADGVKKLEVTSVTRQSIDLAIFGCKMLFNMSCDEANREYVADSGSALVLYVMKFCDEDPTVQHYGCLSLYNFVYRNEPAHTILVEEDVLDVLHKVELEFAGDDNLRKACKRCIAAMEPDGWRGNLATRFNDSIL